MRGENMNDEYQNLRNNLKANEENHPAHQNEYEQNMSSTHPQRDNVLQAQNEYNEKIRRKRMERPLKVFGGLCIVTAILAFMFSESAIVNRSESAKNAWINKISTGVSAGTILLSKDENVAAKDYTITHKSENKDTKIWVWDYAAEDGDYVQVLVNGVPVSDAFMIKHKPRELTVPATGEIQIKGIRDGGGGITYAVRYEINGTSYFNGTPEGVCNTYTLRTE